MLSPLACQMRRSNTTAVPGRASTSTAPRGGGAGRSGRSGRARRFCRWLPGITRRLPRPGRATSVRNHPTLTESRGRGSVSTSRFWRPPSWCHRQRPSGPAAGGWTSRWQWYMWMFQPRIAHTSSSTQRMVDQLDEGRLTSDEPEGVERAVGRRGLGAAHALGQPRQPPHLGRRQRAVDGDEAVPVESPQLLLERMHAADTHGAADAVPCRPTHLKHAITSFSRRSRTSSSTV